MKQVLVCNNCDAIASKPLVTLEVNENYLSGFDFSTRAEIVEVGKRLRSEKSMIEARFNYFKEEVRAIENTRSKSWIAKMKNTIWPSSHSKFCIENFNTLSAAIAGKAYDQWSPKAFMLHFSPQDWLDPDDMLSFNLDDDIYFEWEDGVCCGPTGFFGPNFKCECGNYLGTLCLECNAPEVFIPDPKSTKWQTVKAAE